MVEAVFETSLRRRNDLNPLEQFPRRVVSSGEDSGSRPSHALDESSYSTIAWAASLGKGVQENVQYGYKARTAATGTFFDFLNGLGSVLLPMPAKNVLLEIQAAISSTPEKPSKIVVWR
ncbi:Lysine histidine transporter 1 [Stylosanthes scabra]|uniref:Lysine histidine transporter 1 n=1 Tax=Stylosanthes scabra TaxID=79078 RepID=A0ABU6V4U4_9FABA|nr:Lysine histidine transporter 1 [Stylosanthes scabra]